MRGSDATETCLSLSSRWQRSCAWGACVAHLWGCASWQNWSKKEGKKKDCLRKSENWSYLVFFRLFPRARLGTSLPSSAPKLSRRRRSRLLQMCLCIPRVRVCACFSRVCVPLPIVVT
ncbi:unnamed protein product [Ixodes persulcatus]